MPPSRHWRKNSRSQSVFGADPNLSDGALALRLGDFEEGIRLTLAGLRSPAGKAHSARTRSSAHNNLCAGYVLAGRFQDALENCDEAIRLKKNNWQAYSNRAVLHALTGRLKRAAEDIGQAKRINPDARRLIEAEQFLQERAGGAGPGGARQRIETVVRLAPTRNWRLKVQVLRLTGNCGLDSIH